MVAHWAADESERIVTCHHETRTEQTVEFSPSLWRSHINGSSALLKARHERECQRLHCSKRQADNILLHIINYSCVYIKYKVKNIGSQWISVGINSTKCYLQWGKEPRQTALLSIVTRNIWQFLKSDSILSMDSILKRKSNTMTLIVLYILLSFCLSLITGQVAVQDYNFLHIYVNPLTSRHQIQLAIGQRRSGLD